MVLVIKHNGREYYACSICGLVYESRDYAESCEENCSSNDYGCCGVDLSPFAVGYLVEEDNRRKIVFFEKSRYVFKL